MHLRLLIELTVLIFALHCSAGPIVHSLPRTIRPARVYFNSFSSGVHDRLPSRKVGVEDDGLTVIPVTLPTPFGSASSPATAAPSKSPDPGDGASPFPFPAALPASPSSGPARVVSSFSLAASFPAVSSFTPRISSYSVYGSAAASTFQASSSIPRLKTASSLTAVTFRPLPSVAISSFSSFRIAATSSSSPESRPIQSLSLPSSGGRVRSSAGLIPTPGSSFGTPLPHSLSAALGVGSTAVNEKSTTVLATATPATPSLGAFPTSDSGPVVVPITFAVSRAASNSGALLTPTAPRIPASSSPTIITSSDHAAASRSITWGSAPLNSSPVMSLTSSAASSAQKTLPTSVTTLTEDVIIIVPQQPTNAPGSSPGPANPALADTATPTTISATTAAATMTRMPGTGSNGVAAGLSTPGLSVVPITPGLIMTITKTVIERTTQTVTVSVGIVA